MNEIEKLNQRFVKELDFICNLKGNIGTRLGRSGVTIGNVNNDRWVFGSEIDLRLDEKYMTINYGTTGSFSLNDETPVNRTCNAAAILNRWWLVKDLLTKYTDKFNALKYKTM